EVRSQRPELNDEAPTFLTSALMTIDHWPARLHAVVAAHCLLLRRVTVLRETDSTQDAARRMSAAPGDVIIARRPTSGRGRLGRRWIDLHGEGVALTAVIAWHSEPERLAIAAAVGVARAA